MNSPTPKWEALTDREVAAAGLDAATQRVSYPEREALGHVFTALATVLWALAFTAWACVPAAIWWLYHAVV